MDSTHVHTAPREARTLRLRTPAMLHPSAIRSILTCVCTRARR